MLSGRKLSEQPPIVRPHITTPTSFNYDSWEERAFAQDYSCVWPPRSYSCTFCRREFRSAQALGGHMNVHRRDRARLRQSNSSPTSEETPQIYDADFTPQVGSFSYSYNPNPNPNPNPKPNSICGALAPLITPSGSSSSVRKGHWIDNIGLISSSYSSAVVNQDTQKEEICLISSVQSLKDPIPARKILNLEEFVRVRSEDDSNLKKRKFHVKTDEEMIMISKRRRVGSIVSPLVVDIPLCNRKELDIEVLEICPSPVEELDLELRL
ncbi:hypothetical protein LUZ60_004095 [Juncus effusus]|nr:hypothetical protein LUZ60_004095 [Juncus effusus]